MSQDKDLNDKYTNSINGPINILTEFNTSEPTNIFEKENDSSFKSEDTDDTHMRIFGS